MAMFHQSSVSLARKCVNGDCVIDTNLDESLPLVNGQSAAMVEVEQ